MPISLFRRRGSDRGFSMVELAVTIGLIGLLAAFLIPIYINSQNEAHDTRARENLEHLANQAAAALVDDRMSDYSEYEGPTRLTGRILEVESVYPLTPLGVGMYTYLGQAVDGLGEEDLIGVAVDPNGSLVLSTFSRSGKCWLLKHDPTGAVDDTPKMEFAQGHPDTCGAGDGWPGDDDGGNQPPVAQSATIELDAELTVNLSDYAYDPDGGPAGLVFSILSGSVLQPEDLISWNPGTGTVVIAPGSLHNTALQLDYEVSDGAATAQGRITFIVGNPPTGNLTIGLDCPDEVGYHQVANCTASVIEGDVEGWTWAAPLAVPFDCEDQESCGIRASSPQSIEVLLTARDASGAQVTVTETIEFIASQGLVLLCDTGVSYADQAWCFVETPQPAMFFWSVTAEDISATHGTCDPKQSCPIGANGPGVATVTVRAVDSYGFDETTTSEVEFINRPPTAPVISCGVASSFGAPKTCELQTPSVDPEGGPITYEWSVADCEGLTCEVSRNSPGNVEVTVEAFDEYGASVVETTTAVFINTPPVIESIACGDPVPYGTQTVNCVATIGADPEGDEASYVYSWSQPLGEPPTCGNATECEFTRTTPGSVTTTLTVIDSWGSVATRPGTAVFVNVEPLASITCTPTSVHRYGTIDCIARNNTAANPGPFTFDTSTSDDALGIDGSGTACAPGQTCSFSNSLNNAPVGSYTPRVEIEDLYGGNSSAEGTPVQVVEAPPVFTARSNCTVPTSTSPPVWCEVSVTVSDPDTRNTTASIAWPTPTGLVKGTCPNTFSLNGAGIGTATCAYRSNVVGSTTITPTVTTNGSAPVTAPASMRPVTAFTNRSPQVTAFSLSGDCNSTGNYTSRTCTISITVTDPEGGNLAFSFPTPSQLGSAPGNWIRGGACDGTVAAGAGSAVSRSCSYTWLSVPASGRRRPVGSSSYTHTGPNLTSGTVKVTDAQGAAVTRSTSQLSGFRYRSMYNAEAPTVVIQCSNGSTTVNTSGGNASISANANQTVTCSIHTESDPDGISTRQWLVSGTPNSCASGGGGNTSCGLSSVSSSATVRLTSVDKYCREGGGLGGDCSPSDPRQTTSGTVTITWAGNPTNFRSACVSLGGSSYKGTRGLVRNRWPHEVWGFSGSYSHTNASNCGSSIIPMVQYGVIGASTPWRAGWQTYTGGSYLAHIVDLDQRSGTLITDQLSGIVRAGASLPQPCNSARTATVTTQATGSKNGRNVSRTKSFSVTVTAISGSQHTTYCTGPADPF